MAGSGHNSIGRVVPPLVIAGLCAGGVLWIGTIAHAQHATAGWKAAPGVIRTSRVVGVGDSGDRFVHSYELLYSYETESGALSGSRLTTLGAPSVWLRGGPGAIATRYRVGDLVTVRSEPGNPGTVVLASGLNMGEAVAVSAVGGVLGLVSVASLGVAIGMLGRARMVRTVPGVLLGRTLGRSGRR